MKLLTVLHPTHFCNLACSYCWAPNRNDAGRMPLSVLEKALSQVLQQPGLSRLDLCWLTGEPLAMGLDYFKAAVEISRELQPKDATLQFLLQTNGTLIDDAWADFFRANDFIVGVSIDGPQHLHDRQRKNKAGKGTFEQTLSGVRSLVSRKVRGGALCVITRDTLAMPADELFYFFYERGIAWSYLVEARIGENAAAPRALGHSDGAELTAFLARLMDLWSQHPDAYVRDFDQLSHRLFGTGAMEIDFNNHGCLDIVNVLPNGDFFWGNPELMSAMHGELKSLRGSLNSGNIWQMRQTGEFRRFEDETHAGILKCAEQCDFFIGCRGGNPAHKYYEHRTFDASSHLTCELNDKPLAELLLSKLEQDRSTKPSPLDSRP